ncbi:MAG: hypothetical protein ACRDSJ_03055 [Rubrobacteraceae bacterium]
MTTHQTSHDRTAGRGGDGFLRLALKLDAAASGAAGVLMLLAAGVVVGDGRPFVNLLGAPVALLASAGLFLVAFAAFVWISGARRRVGGTAARTVVAVNALWALASVAVVAAGVFPLTALGVSFVLVQAAAVALFAVMQSIGLQRSRPETLG